MTGANRGTGAAIARRLAGRRRRDDGGTNHDCSVAGLRDGVSDQSGGVDQQIG
jgi:NAD(P)-dependent dehydrogenase (short-subunit alcohol dehydrogenase family)